METLLIERTEDSPKILFDAEKGHLLIQGRSFMEDTNPFYFAILEWSRKYFQNPKSHTILELDFEYLNSSSYRMVIDIVGEFNKYFILGSHVQVFWNYRKEDEDSADMGEELSEMFDIPIICAQLVSS